MTNGQWPHGTELHLTSDLQLSNGAVIPAGTIGTVDNPSNGQIVGKNITMIYTYGSFTPYYVVTPISQLCAVYNTQVSQNCVSQIPATQTNNYIYIEPKVGHKVEIFMGAGRWVTGEIVEVDTNIYGSIAVRPDHAQLVKFIYPKLNQGTTWKVVTENNLTVSTKEPTKSEKDRIWEAVQSISKG